MRAKYEAQQGRGQQTDSVEEVCEKLHNPHTQPGRLSPTWVAAHRV